MPVTERKYFKHDQIGQCELCGKIAPCEVHHRKPLSIGGTNDVDNLIYVCFDCHNREHETNRGETIRSGMKHPKEKEPIIGYYELMADILQLCIDTDNARVSDVIQIINNIPVRRNGKKNFQKDKIRYIQLKQEFLKLSEKE